MGATITRMPDMRPSAPDCMTPFQSQVWDETVANEPSDWFGTCALQHLLIDYCRHRETLHLLACSISKLEQSIVDGIGDISEYRTLLKLRDVEARAAANLAVKLRLTNQSRYTPKAAKTATTNASKGLRPWEV